MANTFDNAEATFATTSTKGPMPRWKRKALEANDRFIPDRSSMDLDACKHSLTSTGTTSSPSKAAYRAGVKSSLFAEAGNNSKILAFKQTAPRPKEGFQAEHHVLYTQNKENAARVARKATRHIPQTAERILDAPELKNDFYLNLLEWSSQNIIAVALAETVYLWNASSGSISELCTLDTSNGADYVSSVSWVGDGSYLAVGTAENKVMLWDVGAERKVRTMYSAGGRVAAMAWNEHTLSTGSVGGTIYNHDVRIQHHVTAELASHTQEVCSLKWSPDGKYLASGANDNVVNIWNAGGSVHKSLTEHTAAVKALAWCPWQSSLLATGGGTADRTIRFWNAQSGSCLNKIDAKSQVSSLLWNKEHREIISGHGFSQNQLSIWSYPTLAKVADLTGHTDRVMSMALSPDGQTVVSAAGDETLRFWKCFATDGAAKKKSKSAASSGKLSASIR